MCVGDCIVELRYARRVSDIELPRRSGWIGGFLIVGLVFMLLGAISFEDKPLAMAAFFLGLGGLITLMCVRLFAGGNVRFRANTNGLWFGGGSTIPWSDIDSIFEVQTDVRVGAAPVKVVSVAILFHRWPTVLRTPVITWFSAPFSVGHIDLAIHHDANIQPRLLASKLAAMRAQHTKAS